MLWTLTYLSAVRIFEALSRKQITEKEEKVKSGLKEIITRAETVKEQTQACLCKNPLSLMAVLISCWFLLTFPSLSSQVLESDH